MSSSRSPAPHLREVLTALSSTVFACLLLSSAIMTGALAQTAGSPPIPQPVPGVDRYYDDTFRILASEDADPLYNTSTMEVPIFHANGSMTIVNETFGTFPAPLEPRALRSTDALVAAYSTDAYQTSLYDNAGTIPYQDTWVPLDSYNHIRTRIFRTSSVTTLEATDNSGEYRVEALNRFGYWQPVYNADVQPDSSADGYSVTNPSNALVHVPDGQWIVMRRLEAVDALLRYSENTSPSTARRRAVIPMEEGSELYPTSNGGSVNRRWQSNWNLIRDTYVGIPDVIPGTSYRGRQLTLDDGPVALVPWDYRIEVPSNYRRSDQCRHRHRVGNTTIIEYHPRTKWARYQLLSHDTTVEVSISNGTTTYPMTNVGTYGMWIPEDPSTNRIPTLTPGQYEITAVVMVEADLREEYGINSAECNSYSRSRVHNETHTADYSIPVQIVDDDSADLEIEATYYDRRGDDILALEWTGDQRLEASPWRHIEVTAGDRRLHFGGPWHFYPVSQSDGVEERTSGGTTTIASGHSYSDQYPRLLRNRVAVSNVSIWLDEPATGSSWWRNDYEDVDRIVPGTALPATINAPDNAAPSPLYNEIGGYVISNDGVLGESVSIEAQTVFEEDIADTSISVVQYQDAEIEVWIANASGSDVFVARLTDANTGAPIAGRTLTLVGATTASVVTNSSGMATAVPNGHVIRATFEGDDWRSSRSTYYLGDTAAVMTAYATTAALNDFFGYLDVGISSTIVLVEWVVLGLIGFWWVRRKSGE